MREIKKNNAAQIQSYRSCNNFFGSSASNSSVAGKKYYFVPLTIIKTYKIKLGMP